MKFLLDECCDASLVQDLRTSGHDVIYAIESLRGANDEEILTRAFSEDRILITEDKDFGEIAYRLRRPTREIILLRFDVSERFEKIPRLRALIGQEQENLYHKFIVLESDKTRIRPLELSVKE